MNLTGPATFPRTIRLAPGRARRLHAWLHGSSGGLMSLGIVIGVGAGLGAVVFRELIIGFTRFFTGYSDYSGVGRVANPHLPSLGPWFLIGVPVLGGLIYGPLIARFAREARGHGVPEVMLAVATTGGRIRPRVAAIKALASAVCIGSGGSVGREGPIVQIGSALGSTLGQLLRIPESRLRLLVACGAAGGISATFNAPIAGVFFALELILRDFEIESFGVVVLASVTANVIGRAAFGAQPFLVLPAFHQPAPVGYVFYAGLGIAAALVGTAFIRVLYGVEDLADRLWHGPEWLRPAAGGLLLGGLLVALPELYGVGYPVLQSAVGGHYTVWLILALLAGKLAATSLTIAIGGSGGVFAPSLFLGAMLGTAYGTGVQHVLPHLAVQPGAYGLVGMGAVFAAAGRAPITSLIIVFELTGDYRIIAPLMVAIVIATAIATLLGQESIYTRKLVRRGIELRRSQPTILSQLTVRQAMRAVPPPLASADTLPQIVRRFAEGIDEALPVVAADGTYAGIVTTRALDTAAQADDDATAGDLAVITPTVQPGERLEAALERLLRSDTGGLPVTDADGQVTGWLAHRDILAAYHRHIHPNGTNAAARRRTGRPADGTPAPAAARTAGTRIER